MSYRADNPLEAEPGPYVGEARCEKCHSKIFRDSLASRHTQTYYRGAQLDQLPLPDKPLADPDDPSVTHTIQSAMAVSGKTLASGTTSTAPSSIMHSEPATAP